MSSFGTLFFETRRSVSVRATTGGVYRWDEIVSEKHEVPMMHHKAQRSGSLLSVGMLIALVA
jgi:hypothetical protein